ncbi:hypothetical protein JCM8115_001141 [Rhodotorula mucilaginosa]
MPSFSLGLDTPTKLFSTGLTPASWSLGGTGLTPSILGAGAGGAYSASGWTPSLTSMAGARSELNPFEISLGNNSSFSSSSSAKRKFGGIDFFDRDDSVTARNSPSSMFDLLATTPSGGGSGRKRAMSSPAVEVGCGSSSFPFFAQQFQPSEPSLSHLGEASFAAGVGGQRSKRPRMASMQSSALTTTEPMFSSFERESDESPPSSVVLTPPDSAPLYSRGLPSNDGQQAAQKDSRDISVVPLSGPSKPPPASQASAAAVAQSTNLLSRLAQERSALIAAGGSGIAHSQTLPLPMPMKQPSADIAVKAEPTDDLHAAAISSPTRPSPVTRGQSRRGGTRSSQQASAPTNAVYTSFNFGGSGTRSGKSTSPTAATTTTTKRKPLRGRKSTNTRKKDETKENNSVSRSASATAAAGEGENDDEDPDADDSTKRQQFLERNRVAACKSRQKKKEKVAGLEQHAADLCARNNMLQQTALALRQEAIALRQLVHAHVGCSCEHAQGYIARDAAGGGIATIDQLAGRVLTLDYSIPPAMGTEDDVYSFLDRGGDAGGIMAMSPTRPSAQAAAAAVMGSAPGPAIPIVARPPAVAAASSSAPTHGSASSTSSVSPVRRTGMMTRRSSMAVHAAANTIQQQQPPPAFEGRDNNNCNDAAFRAAVANNHYGLALDGSHSGTSGSGPLQLRATSAPPTTPGWGDAAPTGDYFAPKRARVSIAA